MSLSMLWVLVLLQENGEMQMSALGARLSVSSAAMTGIIDSLVDHGLVRRLSVIGDRRVCMIQLTAPGVDLLAGKVSTRELVTP